MALTAQFARQARFAQIDMMLVACTTLWIYGVTRHALLGPDWRWWWIGCAAMGLGVITKGVGFLPLLGLVPRSVERRSSAGSDCRPGRRASCMSRI